MLLCLLPVGLQAQTRRDRGGVGGGNIQATTVNLPTGTSSNNGYNSNNPFANDSSSRDSNAVRGLEYHKEIPDSVLRNRVFMFNLVPWSVKIDQVWNPSLDPTGAQFSDHLDAMNGNYYLGKGIVGQPHIALFPTLADGLSEALQPDPNVGYAKRPDNIWLYQTMTPYTVLSYQSSLDKDYQVGISHTQNIRPGWNIAFDYNLLCPEGVYTSSGVKNHYLDATTNYFSPDSRLQAVAGVIWQSFNIDENGGISDDSYFTNQLQSNRAGVPVNLYNQGTTHRENAIFGKISYNLVRQVESYRQRDSLVAKQINDTLTVMDTVKVTDTIPTAKPRVLNAGVLAMEVSFSHSKRLFLDSTLWTERSAALYWTNDAYPDHRWKNPLKVTVGIRPHYINTVIDGTGKMTLTSWLDPFAVASVALWRGTLTGKAMLAGDFTEEMDCHFSGSYVLPFDTAGSLLRLEAVWQREGADVRYIHDAMTNQGLELKQLGTERYEMQLVARQWLDLMVRANRMSHNVWYDSSLTVHEGTSGLWLYQAALSMHLKAGWMHWDMQHLVQHSTDTLQMPVPLLATKNSVYADLRLFSRALRLQVGADLRYHTPFFSPTYDYRTGLFYHQDEVRVGGYVWADLFVNLQVKRASIYLKAGHLNAVWDNSPDYFLLPHYPGRKFGLYWGIKWNFFD